METIILPLDIQISDAIMTFQEQGFKVTQKVFESCGTPRIISKREADIDESRHSFGLGLEAPEPSEHEQDNAEEPSALGVASGPAGLTRKQAVRGKSEFEKMILELKRSIKQSLGFWTKLPYELCIPSIKDKQESPKLPSMTVQQCWNGSDTAPYKSAIVEDGLSNQMLNPEVDLKLGSSPSILNEQLFKLQAVSNRLRMAYSGKNVEWPEDKPQMPSSANTGLRERRPNQTNRGGKGRKRQRQRARAESALTSDDEGVYNKIQVELNVEYLGALFQGLEKIMGLRHPITFLLYCRTLALSL